ncbi:hypothetical protein [Pseudooceanicola onchidii]|uniref:hypothetical protein n=1 Tax=Pseudooceanicola onchidii TaxID=2562279 RepID=UPI0010AA2223|nr:hypothetical protein [Pseudooceanicola onchidii]
MAETAFSRDDLRAAVAAGALTEAQATRVLTLAEERVGTRAAQVADDEPFELFRGFSEIFVTVGLGLLFSAVLPFAFALGRPAVLLVAVAVVCFYLARYFTLKRRMVLPSIALVIGYAFCVFGTVADLTGQWSLSLTGSTLWGFVVCGVTAAALAIWYRVFRLPFTMFLIGLTGMAFVAIATKSLVPVTLGAEFTDLFDLRSGYNLAFGTLIFGICAFLVGMWFDMSDPHRLGRKAASGFWLHLLAALALVNTVALTFYNMQTATGYALLALSLAIIACLALIIDRRSFLTAGIGYIAVLLGVVLRTAEGDNMWLWILLILGIFVTLLGTYWTETRGKLLRALPDFPGKSKLPPYMELT